MHKPRRLPSLVVPGELGAAKGSSKGGFNHLQQQSVDRILILSWASSTTSRRGPL